MSVELAEWRQRISQVRHHCLKSLITPCLELFLVDSWLLLHSQESGCLGKPLMYLTLPHNSASDTLHSHCQSLQLVALTVISPIVG